MKNKVINMFGTVPGGATINDNLAYVDILKDCFLVAWNLNTSQALLQNADLMHWELSTVPVSNNAQNNNWNGTIDQVEAGYTASGTGSVLTSTRSAMSGVAIPLRAGQRLYLHNFNTRAALTGDIYASLYVTD